MVTFLMSRSRLSIKMNQNYTASSRWQHPTVLGWGREGEVQGRDSVFPVFPYPLPPFSNLPAALGGSLGLSIAGFGQWKGNKRTSLPCWLGHLGPTVCLVQTLLPVREFSEELQALPPLLTRAGPALTVAPTAPHLELPTTVSQLWSQTS